MGEIKETTAQSRIQTSDFKLGRLGPLSIGHHFFLFSFLTEQSPR